MGMRAMSDKLRQTMKDHRVAVPFCAGIRRQIEFTARQSGTRESDLIRGAIESQLAAQRGSPTTYEHAKKAGLIGPVKGNHPGLKHESTAL